MHNSSRYKIWELTEMVHTFFRDLSARYSLKNRRRVLHKLAHPAEHLKLQVNYSFYLFIFLIIS